jgi:hypothetical protein
MYVNVHKRASENAQWLNTGERLKPVKALGHQGSHADGYADQGTEQKPEIRACLMADITELGADLLLKVAHLAFEITYLGAQVAKIILDMLGSDFQPGKSMFHGGILR